jgi:thiosulfate reductase/polysulfide reductase chain A
MITTRRRFIKISSLSLGGAAIAASSLKLVHGTGLFDRLKSDKNNKHYNKRIPTYCEVCFWKCAAWTHFDNSGEIVKIIGNDEDPHCYGRLCPRGTGGIGMYQDEDRLKTPLIRVEIDGKQVYKEATWDEALDLIASKFKEVKQQYGAESIALLKHGSPGKHFEHLLEAFGSQTVGEPAYAQCRGPREAAFAATFGSWIGSPEPTDIRDTKCLVLIGSHIGENMHNTQVQEMAEAIDNGACIITVDPRLSTAASKSKYWLPIKPSTDIALLLAWIHVLIYEDLVDQEYIKKFTFGYDQLKKHVKENSPEWAYSITHISPKQIRETAREMANAAPAVIVHPGRHVTWYGDDTQRERAIAILNGLLGSWGKRGGFYLKETLKIPSYPSPDYPKTNWNWKDLLNGHNLAGMGLTQEIIRASIPEENTKHKVKAWLVAGTNLVKAIPNKDLIEKAIDSLDFLVVVDTMPMDITGYADVVLPECTYLERFDELRTATNREPSVALRMPTVSPKYDSKPSWWIAKKLGEKLGLESYFEYDDYSEVVDWQLKQIGTSLEEMEHLGVKVYPRKSGSLYFDNNESFKFATNSGKIELYSTQLEQAGFDPLPQYTAHAEPEEGFYRLIYGRAPMHTFSRTSNNPHLSDLMKENSVWVNPKVADIWGLANGEEVYLKNQDGIISSFPIKVRVTERIRWDAVYMIHGFGHINKKLTRAYGKGACDTELITNVKTDPIMGGTGMRENFVTFIKKENMEVRS